MKRDGGWEGPSSIIVVVRITALIQPPKVGELILSLGHRMVIQMTLILHISIPIVLVTSLCHGEMGPPNRVINLTVHTTGTLHGNLRKSMPMRLENGTEKKTGEGKPR